jgi:large subunit ribosomal protein L24
MNKIRKGDQVIVLAGRDKGKRGVVSLRKDDSHLVVEGINLVKKHTKPNPMAGSQGGIVEKTMPIHQSNVAIYNATTGRADRVGIKILADGSKVRVFKSSGEEIKVAYTWHVYNHTIAKSSFLS